jgi:hypothetical protein
MNPLASRKKLLIAESELNRARMVQDWQVMTDDVHALTKRARTIGSLASAAVALVAGLASYRHKKSMPAAEKPSWLQTVLKGAGLVSTIWQTFHSPVREPKDN